MGLLVSITENKKQVEKQGFAEDSVFYSCKDVKSEKKTKGYNFENSSLNNPPSAKHISLTFWMALFPASTSFK